MAKRIDYLRRLRVFVVVVIVIGVAQGVAAVALALGRDEPASIGIQLAVAVGVALVGASALGARRRFLDRPWKVDTPDDLVAGYAGRLVVQIVLALGSANVAFAGALVTGAAWMVAIGLVLLVGPLLQAAPTTKNLTRLQAWLSSKGCRYDLVASLRDWGGGAAAIDAPGGDPAGDG